MFKFSKVNGKNWCYFVFSLSSQNSENQHYQGRIGSSQQLDNNVVANIKKKIFFNCRESIEGK